MKYVILNKINIEKTAMGSKVTYQYEIPEELSKYLFSDNLFVEFSGDISEVPDSILAIPFVGIMLTVTMLFGCGVRVPELDEVFYNSISEIDDVYKEMYRNSNLVVSVLADKTIFNRYDSDKNSLFFTGGVDATSALVEVADKTSLLINIWGGDVRLVDDDSHEDLEQYLMNISANTSIPYCFIKTNAREVFDENSLGYLCKSKLGRKNNHGWWASIAHILSMTTTIAPWLWLNKITTHYIASSYDPSTRTFDANNEKLIGAIKYSSCSFHGIDSSINRNDKVKKIIKYHNETGIPLHLKVCWYRTAGQNCCSCEKCYRTIMNIIVNHGNPNDYGFVVNKETIYNIRKFLSDNLVSKAFWIPIQQGFIKEKDFWENNSDIAWILKLKINSPIVYFRKICCKIKLLKNKVG